MRKLYPSMNRNSSPITERKAKIMKIIYIPTLWYGIKIRATAKQSQQKKMQVSVNKMLRLALNADYYISNQQIQEGTGTKTLEKWQKTEPETSDKKLTNPNTNNEKRHPNFGSLFLWLFQWRHKSNSKMINKNRSISCENLD